MTTDSDENVFIQDGILTIKPTLQDENLVENNNVLDLRTSGCTGTKWTDCIATTNTTNGTIINPVKSARINTKLGASIKFGRVEVTAKLPEGVSCLSFKLDIVNTNRGIGLDLARHLDVANRK